MIRTAIRRATIITATTALAGAAFAGAAAADDGADATGVGGAGGAGGPAQSQCLVPVGVGANVDLLNILAATGDDTNAISQCNAGGGAGGEGGDVETDITEHILKGLK